MSTWIYLRCEDHNPPLLAEDESGQHLYDLPQLRADIRDRDYMARLYEDTYGDGLGYFRRHTARFLATHKACRLGIVDEYGVEHPLTDDREQ